MSSQRPALIVLSARDQDRLAEQARQLREALVSRGYGDERLSDIAYTLQVGREEMDHRLALLATSVDDLKDKLAALDLDGEPPAGVFRGEGEGVDAGEREEPVEGLVRAGEFGRLAELWTRGLRVDWAALHADADRRPRTVSLPTYPFAGERYWVPSAQRPKEPEVLVESAESGELVMSAGSGLMLFEEVWEEVAVSGSGVGVGVSVVVFVPVGLAGVDGVVGGFVGVEGWRVSVVEVGSGVGVERLGGGRFRVGVGDVGGLVGVLGEVGGVDVVVFLGGLESDGGFGGVVWLVRGLVGAGVRPGRVVLGVEWGGSGVGRALAESWVGFGRSLRMPLVGSLVSVVGRGVGAPGWGEVVRAELGGSGSGGEFVVYGEGGVRWLRRVVSVGLEEGSGVGVVRGGVYVVTGGLGGLGRIFAEWLVSGFGARVVLLGRSPLTDERRAWLERWNASGSGSLTYRRADVRDAEGLRAVIAEAAEPTGRIDGVFHAAGVESGTSIVDKEPADFDRVVAPKIAGTLALDEALAGVDVGVVVYFSSSSAVIGDFGACDYAVGNRFLMAYGREREALGAPGRTVVVSWPLWRSEGMGTGDDEAAEFYLRSSGQRYLEGHEGTAILERLLGQDRSEHLVMAGEVAKVSRFLGLAPDDVPEVFEVSRTALPAPAEPAAAVAAESVEAAGPAKPAGPAAATTGDAAVPAGPGRRGEMRGWSVEECVRWELRDTVSGVLAIPHKKVDPEENLAEFGFDSISLADFSRELTGRFGFEVTPDVFFGYPTLNRLLDYLLSQHAEPLAAFYREAREATPAASPAAASAALRRKAPRPVETGSRPAGEPVAVVGMSGRFPGVRDVEGLWSVLAEGRSTVSEVPADRVEWWRAGGSGEEGVRAGFVPGVAEFDPLFFQISPAEAETMDPRQRLLLQESWNALEDAGYGEERLARERVGVFVGAEEGDYQLLVGEEGNVTGSANSILASRLAYFLNFDGPGMLINTACSSGLVAVHQACQSLQAGECDVAVVAGVNLMLTSVGYRGMEKAGMLSPSGVCRAFDAGADGMVPSEAVAVVVLKRLSRAEEARDAVYASILGSGINYDGKTNGITAPSGRAQSRLLREVYDRAGVSPERIGHIVTHGTGTRLGDPVEINAVADAFREFTDRRGFCALTSTKPNVGHSLAGSGVVSLISLVQGMRKRTIPASIHCDEVNDYIRWDDSPFYVNRETREWPEPEDGRLVGAVSAFGMSGTNAHIVVESHDTEAEAPARAAEWPDRPAHLLALSATSQQALERRITDLIDYLAERPSLTGRHLSAISVELLDGRQHFSHRCAVVVRDREDALDVLREARAGESHPNVFTGTVERGFTPRAAIQRLVGELAGQAAAAIDESAQYRDHLQAQADLYCQGYGVPSGGRAAVVPALRLPGYPFAADAYRPEPGTGGAALAIGVPAAAGGGARGGAALHPLVHRNASDVGGLRFVTEFSGRESFVTGGVLVADALLEMVRASVALSVGGSSPTDGGGVELRDVVWHEGVPAAGGAVEVGLLGQAGGRLSWEVLSGDPNDPELEFVHGVGGARRVDASTRVVDLDAMAELCAEPVEVAGEQRRVAAVHAGESGRRVLVRLEPGRSTVGGDVVLQPGDALAALEAVAEANGRRLASASLLGARRSTFAARGGVTSSVVATVTEVGNGRVVVDLDGCDASGGVLWSLQGVEYGESVERGDVSTDGESEEPAEVAVVGPGRRGEMRGWSVEECALWELQDAVCTVLKLPRENVDPAENLAEFGFDSINLATFAEELSGRFGFEVTPDVFFGYPTLRRLTGYLLEARGDELAAFYRDADVVAASPVLVPAMVSSGVRRRGSRRVGGIRGGDEPVAVVGMSGRFPGVRDVEGLWSVLAEGRSVIGGVPADRVEWWRAGGSGEEGVRAGFVPGVAEFDPLFFQISPAEAETMDPRQRLLLQESWNALEDAGYGERRLNGERVGVFVGAEEGDYQHVVGEEGNVTGSSNSILASRLAYFLNFDGPGMLISTACSSGLVAVHQACQSLQAGECDVAVVAGVNLMLTSAGYRGMEKAGMLSPSGVCRAFDAGADGMVPSEAVAVVVLKRLSRAEEARDAVYASILGSGINYDGKTNGITAPSGRAQSRLLREVYDRAGVSPERIGHIVTHGTGTRLGDPVEINAVADAFREFTDRRGFCALTSTKPNVGHSLAGSGVVSLISLVQGMRKRTIPASIHCDEVNDYIRWDDSPFYVNRETREWPEPEDGRLVGAVSSFGMSGTNAHIVVESHDTGADVRERAAGWPAQPGYLLALSAKTPEALRRRIADLADYLEARPGIDGHQLTAISAELLDGRQHFTYRCAVVVRDREDALQALAKARNAESAPNVFADTVVRSFAPRPPIQQLISELTQQAAALTDPAKYQENLQAQADLYCQGYDLPVPPRPTGRLPLALPTYPFTGDEYRHPVVASAALSVAAGAVEEVASGQGESDDVVTSVVPAGSGLMLFEEVWEEVAVSGSGVGVGVSVVVFVPVGLAGVDGVVGGFVGVEGWGVSVVEVGSGVGVERLGGGRFRVGVGDVGGLVGVLGEVGGVDVVVFLGRLEGDGGFGGVVWLVRGLVGAGVRPGRVVLGVEWGGSGVGRALAESWVGFGRSLRMPLVGSLVSVVGRGVGAPGWGEVVRAELGGSGSGGEFVVYGEGGVRWLRRVVSVGLEEGSGVGVVRGGVYVVTGGLGGLGRIFAEWLVSGFGARVVLLGRSPLTDERRAWMAGLEVVGAGSVRYERVDVCDAAALREVVAGVVAEYGGVDGVFHAAGLESGTSIVDKDAAEFERVVAPKIAGTLALDEALAGVDVGVVVYFSSSSAVIGDFGGCDYAVGNRFLMAYGREREALGAPGRTVVVSWPLWRSEGMGLGDDQSTDFYLRSSGQRYLEGYEGTAVLEALLGQGRSEHLVMAGEVAKVSRFLGLAPDDVPEVFEVAGGSGSGAAAAAAVAGEGAALAAGPGRRGEMRGWSVEDCVLWELQDAVGVVLKLPREKADPAENLAEFGFDSINLATFAEELSGRFGFEVTPDVFFGYPTLRRLTGYLLEARGDELAAFYRDADVVAAPAVLVPAMVSSVVRRGSARRGAGAARGGDEPVAVVGMSGRFPGVRDVEGLWSVLSEGRSVIGGVPADRVEWWRAGGSGEEGVRAGFVPGVAEFDPLFFQISPAEAETMDPRQRLLLQESWNALEDAGYGEERLARERVGVFVGAEEGDYQLLVGEEGNVTGSSNSILASRLAYFLNFDGPGMLINTACSSGLVAVHQACQSLQAGECDVAVVAGVNLMLTSVGYRGMEKAGMLSPSGVCRAFDAGADGMVPSEAVAVVVLKRLSRAEEARDAVYASILGSGINYDGKTNGITAPSGRAQSQLLREVYDRAGVSPERIGHIVTHGTGTRLGDPVEINAVADAFREFTDRRGFCALTSTKPNVGHSLAGSGVVSLISLVQGMRKRTIPASIHCDEVNDYIRWDDSPFYVNRETREWPESEDGRLVGAVSSFGMSGTNAHVLVESHGSEAEDRTLAQQWPSRPAYLLALSAKSPEGLERRIADLLAYVAERRDLTAHHLSVLCAELLDGRQHFPHRCAVVVRDRQDALQALAKARDGESAPNVFSGEVLRRFVAQSAIRQVVAALQAEAVTVEEPARAQELLYALADFYCQGYGVAGAGRVAALPRLGLPGYPFAGDEFRPAPSASALFSAAGGGARGGAALHPLVHRNASDVGGLRFVTEFSGREPFVSSGVLVADALLEMVRASVALSAGGSSPTAGGGVELRDVVWHEGVPAAGGAVVEVALSAYAGGRVGWEVFSADPNDPELELVHGAGGARRLDMALRVVDLDAVARECAERIAVVPAGGRVAGVFVGGRRVLVRLEPGRSTLGDVVLQPGDALAALEAVVVASGGQLGAGTLLGARQVALPVGVGVVSTVVATVGEFGNGRVVVDLDGCDASGGVLWSLHGAEYGFSQADPRVGADGSATGGSGEVAEVAVAGPGRRGEMRGWSVEECLLWELRDAVCAVLKLPPEKVDADDNFAEFGFDSINLAEFAEELGRRFHFTVTPDVFFGYPTLVRLSHFLLGNHGDELAAFYRDAELAAAPALVVPATVSSGVRRRGSRRVGGIRGGDEPVAVVGMSGRFPGVRDVEGLWSVLSEGRSVIGGVPADRVEWWRAGGSGEEGVRAGFVPGVAEFDPLFFQISPREAETMDPRQRLLLQESWNALEDAGYGEERLARERVGVFVGAEEGDYQLVVGEDGSVTAASNSILASRLAYFLNFDGPGMLISTACSSGLVAVHQACQSLQAGECDVAVVAGVNLMLTSAGYRGMEKAGMLSPSGVCRAFDAGADGMVPSEAVAVVVLKRLSRAEEARDAVYASILGSGINYDGKTNGITAPSGRAQSRLLREVYDRAGVSPERIGHIVTHGTGTRLGDPVEINAVADAFREFTDRTGFCALTSTKPNVGHSLAGSGVVSLISLVQGMRKRTIPASIHCDEVNDYIRWDDSPFYVNRETREWPEPEDGRLVGAVSSFGMSGTNAHIVVESHDTEADISARTSEWPTQPAYLLALSAKTPEALRRRIADLADYLEARPGIDRHQLTAISAELLDGRHHFGHRCAVVVRDGQDAAQALRRAQEGESGPGVFLATVGRAFSPRPPIQQLISELAQQAATLTDPAKYQENLQVQADLYSQGFELRVPPRPTGRLPLALPSYPFLAREFRPGGHERREEATAEAAPASAMPVTVPETGQAPGRPSRRKAAHRKPAQPRPRPQPKHRATSPARPKPTAVGLSATADAPPARTATVERAAVALAAPGAARGADGALGKPHGVALSPLGSVVTQRLDAAATARAKPDGLVLPPLRPVIETAEPLTDVSASVVEAPSERTSPSTPPTGDDEEAYRAFVGELVVSLAAELYVEPEEVALDMTFTDLGLDSIVGVEWIRWVNQRYGLSVESTRIYQYPTVPEFARFLWGEVGGVVASGRSVEPVESVVAEVVGESEAPVVAEVGDEGYRDLLGELVVSLAAELYVEPEEVALDMTFTDLGLDSIVGVEWIRWVNQRYGLSVESTRIYQYPTVPEFARFLWGEVGGVVASGRSVEPVESVVAEVVGESEAPVVAEVGDEGYRDLLGELVVSLAAELYVEPEEVALDMTFTDLGLDSIVGVEWIRWVNQRYGLSVESTRIYQHPTLSEFGRFLMGELAESGNPAGAAGGGTAELDVEQVLERVYSGELSPEQAEELLTEIH